MIRRAREAHASALKVKVAIAASKGRRPSDAGAEPAIDIRVLHPKSAN